MIKRCIAAVLLVAALWELGGCGGGGGDGNSSGSGNSSANGGSQSASLSVSLSDTAVAANASPSDSNPEVWVDILVLNAPDSGLYLAAQPSYAGVALANITGADLQTVRVQIRFRSAGSLPNGTYTDGIQVDVCLDAQCARPAPGSPFRITTNYTVTGSTATAAPKVLAVSDADAIDHDVVDAEFSKSLNSVLMASSSPSNALYVYDVATRSEKTVALDKVPTSVSLSPDGAQAAIGHNQFVSYVDLSQLGAGAAPAPKLLNVSAPVYDLALDASGHVYVFPAADQWVALHTVDVASNSETLGTFQMFAKTIGKLSPTGEALYSLDTLLSPENIERFSLSNGVVTGTDSAPYWGDYPMCGGLWFSEDGGTLFTSCGNTFRASDMVYTGRLPLTDDRAAYSPTIVSLSHSAARREIAMLDTGSCGALHGTDCETLVRLIDSDSYAPIASYWLKPTWVDGQFYSHHGMFVFHTADGTQWIVDRLSGAERFYVSRVDAAAPNQAQLTAAARLH